MKVRFKSLTALLAAFALLLSIFSFDVVSAQTDKLEDGIYHAEFMIYSDGTTKESVMYGYADKTSGKLVVEDGEILFQSSWNNYNWFKYLGVLEEGKTKSIPYSYAESAEYMLDNYMPKDYTAAAVLDVSGRTSIPITEVDALQEMLVHVNATPIIPGYNNWYNIQLQITKYWKDGDSGNGGTDPGETPPVDVTILEDAVQAAKQFDATVLPKGTISGNSNIVSEGEYPAAAKESLVDKIKAAEAALATTDSTQSVIDAMVTQLNQTVEEVKAQQIHGKPVKLTVLDGILPTIMSTDAAWFAEDATVFQIGTNYYANITIQNPSAIYKLHDPSDSSSVRTAFQSADDLTKLVSKSFIYSMLQVSEDSDKGTYVGQIDLRAYGLAKFRYQTSEDEATRKIVYLNFNGIELKHLQDGAAAAQKLHDSAVVGEGNGQYSAEAKANFQTEIDAVKVIADDYAAPLTSMAGAEQKLAAAIDAFIQAQNKQSGSYQATLTASSSDLLKYVEESGKIDVQNNKYTVTFAPKAGVTIKKLIHTITKEEIWPVGQNVKRLSVVTLAAAAAPKFEISDILSPYSLVLDTDTNGSIQELSYEIAFSDIKPDTSSSTPTPGPGTGSSTDTTPVVVPADSGAIKDGSYYVDYKVLKADSNEESVMNKYVVQKALLKAENGVYTVYLTLKQDKEITSLQVEGKETEVISRNDARNTRVISFKVRDLSALLKGHITLNWPAMNYQHADNIQFSFDKASLLAVGASSNVPGVEVVTEDAIEVPFTDIEGHWAQAAIEEALKQGIVAEGSKFNPNQTITRAEFAALLGRALQLPATSAEAPFADYSSIPDWAKPHVASIQKIGLINGYADQTFRASQSISRAELAVIVAKAVKLDTNAGAALTLADAAQVPAWAAGSVAAGVEAGMLHGRGGNRFDPSGHATRAEAQTLVMKIMQKLQAA